MCHWAPVLRIQRTASRTSRGTGLRPGWLLGRWESDDALCVKVTYHQSGCDVGSSYSVGLGGVSYPDSLEAARKRIAASIIQRRGQPEFRRKLLEAYGRRCAVTGCDVEAALEACHIVPYKGPETNHTSNGLLLRADLHVLFDLGLIAFDLEKQETLVAERLQGTFYNSLAGETMNMPSDPTLRPSKTALECHRRQAGL